MNSVDKFVCNTVHLSFQLSTRCFCVDQQSKNKFMNKFLIACNPYILSMSSSLSSCQVVHMLSAQPVLRILHAQELLKLAQQVSVMLFYANLSLYAINIYVSRPVLFVRGNPPFVAYTRTRNASDIFCLLS